MLHPTCCMLHPTGCTLQYRTTPYTLGPTTPYAVNPKFYKRGAGEAGKLKITDIQSLQNFFSYTKECVLLHSSMYSLTQRNLFSYRRGRQANDSCGHKAVGGREVGGHQVDTPTPLPGAAQTQEKRIRTLPPQKRPKAHKSKGQRHTYADTYPPLLAPTNARSHTHTHTHTHTHMRIHAGAAEEYKACRLLQRQR